VYLASATGDGQLDTTCLLVCIPDLHNGHVGSDIRYQRTRLLAVGSRLPEEMLYELTCKRYRLSSFDDHSEMLSSVDDHSEMFLVGTV